MLRLRLAAIGLGACVAAGCYTMQPVATTAVAEGKEVAFDVSDVGRVALGGAMGPSLSQIEGRLVRRDSGEMLVAVSSVRFLTGGTQTWSGEPVRLKPEYIATSYNRRLSKSRTLAASAVGLGAVAFIVTRSVSGGGDVDAPRPGENPGTSARAPRP